jgi:hypothetical protein
MGDQGMKVGIETGVAILAAGLLTTGQKALADEQPPATDAVTTQTSQQATTTPKTETATATNSNDTGNVSADEPTIAQQLQSVVSTQLQADASAQVAAQKKPIWNPGKHKPINNKPKLIRTPKLMQMRQTSTTKIRMILNLRNPKLSKKFKRTMNKPLGINKRLPNIMPSSKTSITKPSDWPKVFNSIMWDKRRIKQA